VTDDTAQKRVSRALDKLRESLSRRGINSTAAALSIVLSANAVQTAPAGLAVTISAAAALAGSGVTSPTMIAAAKAISMTTIQKALITAAAAAAIGAGIYEAVQNSTLLPVPRGRGYPGPLGDRARRYGANGQLRGPDYYHEGSRR
jgi:hypothetical protein